MGAEVRTVSCRTSAEDRRRGQLRAVACCLAIAVAAAASIGCRAAEDFGTAPTPEPGEAAVAPDPVLGSPGQTWVYFVGSDGAADELRAAAATVPAAPLVVIVADSEEQARALADFERSLEGMRAEAGEPPVRVTLSGPFAAAE